MARSELNKKNYRRIFFINVLLCLPLMVLFAWPYLIFSHLLQMRPLLTWPGTLLFSLAFTLTILHGHVTMALGSAHRHHFYNWLEEHPLTYGLFFNSLLTATRFRLILLVISLLLLLVTYIMPI